LLITILEHTYKKSLQSFLLFLYSFCLFGCFCFEHIIGLIFAIINFRKTQVLRRLQPVMAKL